MARAKHLKMASILWWLERPYITLACRLAPAWFTKPPKKSSSNSDLQIAHAHYFDQVFVNQRGASAQIHGDYGERLIHRLHEIPGAVDAFAIAQSLREQLSEHDAGVFDRVMLIHVEVAFGVELEIEPAVLREKLQHVIEEANAGRNLVAAAAFDLQTARDARLFRVSLDRCPSHSVKTSSR